MALHPCQGQIGAQTLNIDVVAVKAHLGSAHQWVALIPFVVAGQTHIAACESILLSLKAFGSLNGVAVGDDRERAVILVYNLQTLIAHILEDVAHLVLREHQRASLGIVVEHSVDHLGRATIYRIEIEVIARVIAVILHGERHCGAVAAYRALDPCLGQINTESLQIDIITVDSQLERTAHLLPSATVVDVTHEAIAHDLEVAGRSHHFAGCLDSCLSGIVDFRNNESVLLGRQHLFLGGSGQGGKFLTLHLLCAHRHRHDDCHEQ